MVTGVQTCALPIWYDPLFLPDGLGGSFADIPPETKNAVSHRAAALRALLQVLDAEEW